MENTGKELEAIGLGKEWMKRSINVIHDYEHASEVARYSLSILESFRANGEIIDQTAALLAAWWHDAYKATLKGETIHSLIFEGYESERIMRKEIGKLVSPETLLKAGEAIRYHNHPPPFFLVSKRNFTPQFRVLYEADYIEMFNVQRIKRDPRFRNSSLAKFFFKVYYAVYSFLMNRLPRSEYLKNYLFNIKF